MFETFEQFCESLYLGDYCSNHLTALTNTLYALNYLSIWMYRLLAAYVTSQCTCLHLKHLTPIWTTPYIQSMKSSQTLSDNSHLSTHFPQVYSCPCPQSSTNSLVSSHNVTDL